MPGLRADRCIRFQADGDDERYCATDLYRDLGHDTDLTDAQKTALQHAFSALPNIGLVTSQSGNSWYVSPIRSVVSLGTEVLSGLGDNDLITIIQLLNKH